MKPPLNEGWKSVRTLIRFVFWYAIGLAAVLYLLPMAGRLIEAQYDAMSGMAKLFTRVGFLALVVLWHRRSGRGPGE
jgi:hypothetical protein